MKIIVTGCKGQLGTELLKQLQEGRSELGPIPEKLLNATVIPVDLPDLLRSRPVFLEQAPVSPGFSRIKSL